MGYSVFRDFEEENTASMGADCSFLDNPNESIKDYIHCEDIKGSVPADSSMTFQFIELSQLYFSFLLLRHTASLSSISMNSLNRCMSGLIDYSITTKKTPLEMATYKKRF